MKEDKIIISTVPVTIRVIEVGGKRMTLSVFNQIQDSFFFEDGITEDEKIKTFLGWVDHKDKKYILFHRDGTLKKDRFDPEVAESFLFRAYRNRMETYNKAVRDNWGELSLDRYKKEMDDAKIKYEESKSHAESWNKMYSVWLKDEYQIFISI